MHQEYRLPLVVACSPARGHGTVSGVLDAVRAVRLFILDCPRQHVHADGIQAAFDAPSARTVLCMDITGFNSRADAVLAALDNQDFSSFPA